MAVADVQCARTANALRHSVAGADHEIEIVQMERLDRCRKQWQEISVMPVYAGNAIQRGSHDRVRFNERRNLAAFVKERMDCGSRKQFEEGFENFLTSTHPV